MKQFIDQGRLNAAAEHLERVLGEYPDEPVVRGMLDGLRLLLEAAKAGEIQEPMDRRDVPFAYNAADGRYSPYTNPDVEGAYYEFAAELRGGRDKQEEQLIADTRAMIDAGKTHGEP